MRINRHGCIKPTLGAKCAVARILQKIAQLIEDNLDRFAEAESRDNGKPLSLAKRVDIPRAAANFNFYATGVLHYASEAHQMEDTAINYTTREGDISTNKN